MLYALWISTFVLLLSSCASVPVRRIAREQGTRAGSCFYHIGDGYQYHKNRQRNGHIYFKCIRYALGCLGRATYDPNEGFSHTTAHNGHDPDEDYPDVMACRRNILERCRNLEYITFHRILDEETMRYRRSVRMRVTLANMRRSMALARAANYPNLPRKLLQLTAILMDNQNRVISMVRDGQDSIYAGSITARDGSHHVLFVSQRMRQHLNTMNTWFADGTFWAAPRTPQTHQIFSIVTVWGSTIIPVAWALMERRTEDGYEAVLRLLQRRLLEEGREPAVVRIITDFEEGQQNAWRTVFPNAVLQGCLWHACRAFVKYAVKQLRLLRWMRNVPHIHMIVRLCCALPLLPPNLMLQGLIVITREARGQGDFLYQILRPFLRYIFNQWLRTRQRRATLSVYGSLFRTNNACESHNSNLNSNVGNAHPNIFTLLRTFVRIEHRAYDNVTSLRAGVVPNRPRKARSVRNDRRVRALERDLRHPPGPIDEAISRFLHAASHTLDNVMAAIVGDDAEEPRENR